MTREEMLAALGKLPFALIWPGDWEDIGFTEREIWVNNKGYGYIMCDEPTQYWEGPGIEKEKWQSIKEKVQDESITYEDIKGTSIEDMLDTMSYSNYDFEDSERLCFDLSELASTDIVESYFYAFASVDGTQYFDSLEAFKSAYERDWADEFWDDMTDDLLSEWIDRLSIEDDPELKKWAQMLSLEPDVCEEDALATVTETDKIDAYWTAHNTQYFKFCCNTTVFEGDKKRYVSLIAEGKDENNHENCIPCYVTRTVFEVVSTRNNTVMHCVVAGMPEHGSTVSNDKALGKWLPIKDKLYQNLLRLTERVAGKDIYAQSLDLLYGLRAALMTDILDETISLMEQRS